MVSGSVWLLLFVDLFADCAALGFGRVVTAGPVEVSSELVFEKSSYSRVSSAWNFGGCVHHDQISNVLFGVAKLTVALYSPAVNVLTCNRIVSSSIDQLVRSWSLLRRLSAACDMRSPLTRV